MCEEEVEDVKHSRLCIKLSNQAQHYFHSSTSQSMTQSICVFIISDQGLSLNVNTKVNAC